MQNTTGVVRNATHCEPHAGCVQGCTQRGARGVYLPDAVGNPGAVVVELLHALVAHGAVLGADGAHDLPTRNSNTTKERGHLWHLNNERQQCSGEGGGREEGGGQSDVHGGLKVGSMQGRLKAGSL